MTITRRTFIHSAGAAAAWTGIGRLAIGQETFPRPEPDTTLLTDDTVKKHQRFKKAVKIGMVKVKGTLIEKFQLLKDLGFDGVEMHSPGGPSAEEVREAIEATGLPVHGVVDSRHWRDTLSHPNEKTRRAGLDALTKAIHDSKAYGGSSVLLVPGVVNDEVTYEQCWERSQPLVKEALAVAEETGIDILLENVWNNFLNDPKETARYIDELESERIGAYYDVGNSVRYAPPVEWVETLGKRIKKLDIKEYDLPKAKKEGWRAGFQVKLTEGTCDWPEVIAALKKLGFSGWGTAEVRGGDRERLADIARRMDKIFAS